MNTSQQATTSTPRTPPHRLSNPRSPLTSQRRSIIGAARYAARIQASGYQQVTASPPPYNPRSPLTSQRRSIIGAARYAARTQASGYRGPPAPSALDSTVEDTAIPSIEVDEEYEQNPVRPLLPLKLAFRDRFGGKQASTTPGSEGSRRSDAHLPANIVRASIGKAGASDSPLTSIVEPSGSPPTRMKLITGLELTSLGYDEDQIAAALRATSRAGASVSAENCINWIHGLGASKAGASDSPLTSIITVSSSPPLRAKIFVADELTTLGYREDQVSAAIHAVFKAGAAVSTESCITWIENHTSPADGELQLSRGGSQVGSASPRRRISRSGSDAAPGSTGSYHSNTSAGFMAIDVEGGGSSAEDSQDSDYQPIDAAEVRELLASPDRPSSSDVSDTEPGAEALANEDEDGMYDDVSDRGSEASVQESRLAAKLRIETLYSLQGCDCVEEASLKRKRQSQPAVQDLGRLSGPAKMADFCTHLMELGITDACGIQGITRQNDGHNPRHRDPAPDWRLALAGHEDPAVLDMWASESRSASRLAAIKRWFDIDAFLGEPTSLAAHRQGFWISFYSRFSKQISQDQYLRFNGVKPYKCKHLRLGFGEASIGWDTYVLFPRMPLGPTKVTHLTDEEQSVWVNEVTLAACRGTQSPRTLQRMPRNFEADRLKARARQGETTSTQSINQLESFYLLPGNGLASLWDGVQDILGQNRVELDAYRGAFLLVVHYGCKDNFAAETMQQARTKFVDFFHRAFDQRYMPLDCCWVDLAWEDVPLSPAGRAGTTLLQKAHCLKSAFEEAGLKKPQQYTWQMTGDAGSARRAAGWNHPNRHGGFVFMQGYNVEKEDFATLTKQHKLFGDKDLENLAVPEATLKRWAEANRAGSSSTVNRRLLLEAFDQCKKRAATPTLGYRYGKNWGRRSEVRISTALLAMLDEPTQPPTGTSLALPGCGRHRSFWVLLDPTVGTFKVMNYNRYIAAIELLIDRVGGGRDQSETARLERQAHDSAMLKALLETLRYTANDGFPQEQSALWHRRYSPRHMQKFDVNGRLMRARGPAGLEKQGLGLSESLAKYNFAWLPADMFNWRTLTFKDDVLRQTTFLHRNFARFKHWKRQRLADREDQLLAEITEKLRRAAEAAANDATPAGDSTIADNLALLCQLISQSVAKHVIHRLMRPRRNRGLRPVPEMDPTGEILTREERQGYMGLHPSLVKRALGSEDMFERMAYPRGFRSTDPIGSKQNVSDYPNRWHWKLRLLLDASLDFKPTWHNAPFRTLTSRCASIVEATLGKARGARFRKGIGFKVARYIRMVPIFERTRLRRNMKEERGVALGAAPKLTAWICAYCNSSDGDFESDICTSEYALKKVDWTRPGPRMRQLAEAIPAMSDTESEGDIGDGDHSEAQSMELD